MAETVKRVDVGELKKRYEHLKGERKGVESTWAEIEQFVSPMRDGGGAAADVNQAPNLKRPEIWDFTAIECAQRLAASLHGALTSPSARWFRFGFTDKALEKDKVGRGWLDECADAVWAAIQESDFNSEIACAYQDLVAPGHTIVIEETVSEAEWKGLDFTTVPLREAFVEEDSRGEIARFFRRLGWTAVQMVHKFGVDKVPLEISQLADKPEGATRKLEVVFAIYPRADWAKEKDGSVTYPAAPLRRPWGFCYFIADGPGAGELLGEEGGYYECPVSGCPWEKTAGSYWGFGPATIALPGVKYLNGFKDAMLAAAEKAVDPASLVEERALLSNLNQGPGEMTVVTDVEGVKTFESGARFDWSKLTLDDLRTEIRRLFHEDQLQLKDSPQMTAEEARIRYELMSRVIGSTLSRLQTNLFGPIVRRAFAILFRANKLPALPESLKGKKIGEYQIEYQGPLARSQRMDEVVGIERTAMLVAKLVEMGFKDAALTFDAGEAVRLIAALQGAPTSVTRSAEAVEKLKKAEAELQQRMMQAEAARAEGEAVEQGARARQAGMPA